MAAVKVKYLHALKEADKTTPDVLRKMIENKGDDNPKKVIQTVAACEMLVVVYPVRNRI